MLSNHSFNALLKTLEEPPEHVKFLLATTDPQKLPATVLSRCLQFNLKNMLPERIVGHLEHVLAQESIPFETPALWQLANAAQGSMRDAMSLTDQAIAFSQGQVNETDVRAMLGSIDRSLVYELAQALSQKSGQNLLDLISRLAQLGVDFQAVLAELIVLLHQLTVAQIVPQGVDNSQGDGEKTLQLAAQFSAEELQLYYQMALHGRRDFPLNPDPRSALEMTLLRMLAFRPAGIPEPVGQLPHSEPNVQPQALTPEATPEKKP